MPDTIKSMESVLRDLKKQLTVLDEQIRELAKARAERARIATAVRDLEHALSAVRTGKKPGRKPGRKKASRRPGRKKKTAKKKATKKKTKKTDRSKSWTPAMRRAAARKAKAYWAKQRNKKKATKRKAA